MTNIFCISISDFNIIQSYKIYDKPNENIKITSILVANKIKKLIVGCNDGSLYLFNIDNILMSTSNLTPTILKFHQSSIKSLLYINLNGIDVLLSNDTMIMCISNFKQ